MKGLLREKKWGLAKLLSDNSRYVDDVGIMNYKNFEGIVSKIYPPSLKVERNGNNDKIIDYLDVHIELTEGGVVTTVYNKVDSFDFEVVTFTFPSSNIPLQIGYNIFMGQLLRYAVIISCKENFVTKIKGSLVRLNRRGYEKNRLIKVAKRKFNERPFLLHKFGFAGVRQFIESINDNE